MRPDQKKFVERARKRRIEQGEKRRRKIVVLLTQAPSTQHDLAKACKCTRTTIRWHLHALMKAKRIALAGFRRDKRTGKDHFLYSLPEGR